MYPHSYEEGRNSSVYSKVYASATRFIMLTRQHDLVIIYDHGMWGWIKSLHYFTASAVSSTNTIPTTKSRHCRMENIQGYPYA